MIKRKLYIYGKRTHPRANIPAITKQTTTSGAFIECVPTGLRMAEPRHVAISAQAPYALSGDGAFMLNIDLLEISYIGPNYKQIGLMDLYTKFKQLWRSDSYLCGYEFPLYAITDTEIEIRGPWRLHDSLLSVICDGSIKQGDCIWYSVTLLGSYVTDDMSVYLTRDDQRDGVSITRNRFMIKDNAGALHSLAIHQRALDYLPYMHRADATSIGITYMPFTAIREVNYG